jgi:hypothetical protein
MENNLKEITKNLGELFNFANGLIKQKEQELTDPKEKAKFVEQLRESNIVAEMEKVRKQLSEI